LKKKLTETCQSLTLLNKTTKKQENYSFNNFFENEIDGGGYLRICDGKKLLKAFNFPGWCKKNMKNSINLFKIPYSY
jgi:hypothetical protein